MKHFKWFGALVVVALLSGSHVSRAVEPPLDEGSPPPRPPREMLADRSGGPYFRGELAGMEAMPIIRGVDARSSLDPALPTAITEHVDAVDRLDVRLVELQSAWRAVRTLEAHLVRADAAIAQATKRHDETLEELAAEQLRRQADQEVLDEVVVLAFINGGTDFGAFGSLLTGDSSDRATRRVFASSAIDAAVRLVEAADDRISEAQFRVDAASDALDDAIESRNQTSQDLVAARTHLEEETAAVEMLEGAADLAYGALQEVLDTVPTRLKRPGERVAMEILASSSEFAFPVQGDYEFGEGWADPRDDGMRWHEGTDVLAPLGTPLVAIEPGWFEMESTNELGGLVVYLRGQSGYTYYYSHLSAVDPAMYPGKELAPGDVVGYVGMSGNAGAPHLHLGIKISETEWVNPYPLLRGVMSAVESEMIALGVRDPDD